MADFEDIPMPPAKKGQTSPRPIKLKRPSFSKHSSSQDGEPDAKMPKKLSSETSKKVPETRKVASKDKIVIKVSMTEPFKEVNIDKADKSMKVDKSDKPKSQSKDSAAKKKVKTVTESEEETPEMDDVFRSFLARKMQAIEQEHKQRIKSLKEKVKKEEEELVFPEDDQTGDSNYQNYSNSEDDERDSKKKHKKHKKEKKKDKEKKSKKEKKRDKEKAEGDGSLEKRKEKYKDKHKDDLESLSVHDSLEDEELSNDSLDEKSRDKTSDKKKSKHKHKDKDKDRDKERRSKEREKSNKDKERRSKEKEKSDKGRDYKEKERIDLTKDRPERREVSRESQDKGHSRERERSRPRENRDERDRSRSIEIRDEKDKNRPIEIREEKERSKPKEIKENRERRRSSEIKEVSQFDRDLRDLLDRAKDKRPPSKDHKEDFVKKTLKEKKSDSSKAPVKVDAFALAKEKLKSKEKEAKLKAGEIQEIVIDLDDIPEPESKDSKEAKPEVKDALKADSDPKSKDGTKQTVKEIFKEKTVKEKVSDGHLQDLEKMKKSLLAKVKDGKSEEDTGKASPQQLSQYDIFMKELAADEKLKKGIEIEVPPGIGSDRKIASKEGSIKIKLSCGSTDANGSDAVFEQPVKEDDGGVKPTKPVVKLGAIKISETSAALIQSGVRYDPKKANMEEGELTATEDEDDQDSSSSGEDGPLDDLDDSGSVSDDEGVEAEGETGGKKKKKKKKHKAKHKKKKKHHDEKDSTKRRKSREGSRSRSPKRHRHSRSRSNSRSKSSTTFDKDRGIWIEKSRRSRSRDRDRHRRSSSKDRGRKRSRSPDRRDDKFYRSYYAYERERFGRWGGRRSRSRSRSRDKDRERDRDRERGRKEHDLRLKIDKAKLREIAIANAYKQAKAGSTGALAALNLQPDEVARLKAGGQSVQELTEFCKKMARKDGDNLSSSDSDNPLRASDDEDAPFVRHHPFKIKDPAPINMNIRNAKQLPVMSLADKMAASSTLRLQFPVSSGTNHRDKEGEWVPVEKTSTCTTVAILGSTPATKKGAGIVGASAPAVVAPLTITTPAITPATATTTVSTGPTDAATAAQEMAALPPPSATPALPAPPVKEDKVFPDPPSAPINIGELVTERLSALRKLQNNPHDVEAIGKVYKAQQQMNQWATSKQLPGHFTGSTGVTTLTPQELAGVGNQAWLKKDTFTKAAPIRQGIGMMLLEKMGWKQGTGLGKSNIGSVEPLTLDFNTNRKGLAAQEEQKRKGKVVVQTSSASTPVVKDLSGKHPVSALVELCTKRKWGSPDFVMVNEGGPDHKKNFLFKVRVNGAEYQPAMGCTTKKQAKAMAAQVCLQEFGLIPR